MKLPESFIWIWGSRRARLCLSVAVILFASSVLCDWILTWKGITPDATYLNDIVIGLTGAVCAAMILSYQANHEAMERARERAMLTVELNQQIRSAVLQMTNSALLNDEGARLRAVDEAVQQIDDVLTGLVPSGGSKHYSHN